MKFKINTLNEKKNLWTIASYVLQLFKQINQFGSEKWRKPCYIKNQKSEIISIWDFDFPCFVFSSSQSSKQPKRFLLYSN